MAKVFGFVATTGVFLRRHVLWSVAAVALVLGGAALLGWNARARRPKYVTAVVTRGNIQRSVSTTGALNPVVTVQVGSYVSGTLKSLSCDYNTEVVVGQLCATIDPVPFQLIVDQDRAQVGTAEAQLRKDQASLAYAKTAFERDAKLVAEGTVSQDTVDSEKSAYDQAVAQIGLDQAAIVDKQALLKAAQVNLAYTNIVSPVVGTVITRSIDVGQTVAASLQSPTLFLIGKDLTHMLAAQRRAAIDAYDAGLATYQQTVLEAFAQVADALTAIEHDGEMVTASQRAVAIASSSLALQRSSYAAGRTNALQLIAAEDTYSSARLGYVRALGQRLADTAQLFVAVGGGWWNDSESLPQE